MSDFSNLTYKQKALLLSEVQESMYNHKHTIDELKKLELKIGEGKIPLILDDYNILDRNVLEILKNKNKKKQNGKNNSNS